MNGIVLDTETTGLDPNTHRVIEIAIAEWESGEPLFHSLINPECFIPEEITKITGICDDDVASAPTFIEIAAQVAAIVCEAEAVIGYNPGYDRGMINGELSRLPEESRPEIRWPTLVCAKRLWDAYEPREERNLKNAYKRFVDARGFDGAHRAMGDVRATREVLRSQMDHFGLHGKTWEELDPQRGQWWGPTFHVLNIGETLLLNFGKNKGKPVHEIQDGFWRWLLERDFPDHVLALGLKMRELIPEYDNQPEKLRRALHTWAVKSNWIRSA